LLRCLLTVPMCHRCTWLFNSVRIVTVDTYEDVLSKKSDVPAVSAKLFRCDVEPLSAVGG